LYITIDTTNKKYNFFTCSHHKVSLLRPLDVKLQKKYLFRTMILTNTHVVWSSVFLFCVLISLANAEDFYKMLGISRKATNKEIKKAYRQKSLEFHPDKNKAEGAADKFAQINRAYEALMDEEKRKIYDRQGEEGLKQPEQREAGGGGGDSTPLNSFSDSAEVDASTESRSYEHQMLTSHLNLHWNKCTVELHLKFHTFGRFYACNGKCV